jgi:hypothetical protein
MNLSKYSVTLGLIALTFMASANAAIVETFNLNYLGSGLLLGAPQYTPLGIVTLTQSGTTVEVNVALSAGDYFQNSSNGNAMTPFVFNLNTNPVSVSSITATQMGTSTTSTSVYTYSPGPLPATPFGTFANGVVCSNCSSGGSPPHYSILDFTVTGVSNGNFIGNHDSTGNWYFAADVNMNINNQSYTGTVASTMSPVPEPRTYAMLLAGLGLIAFTVRRNRHVS